MIKQKKYLGLRGSGWRSEGNRKTRNEVTRPKVLFEFKARSLRQIAIAKANSKKQLYFKFKEGKKSKGEKKRGSLTYINWLHTKGKIDSS